MRWYGWMLGSISSSVPFLGGGYKLLENDFLKTAAERA